MTAKAREWFRVQAAVDDPTVTDIHIIDFIGGWYEDAANRFWGESIGVTARAFVEQLSALGDSVKTIRVHINSPGGDVQAGVNIANALREQVSKGRTVETIVDGLAASSASVIAMAGSVVRMADNALLMIHNPWSWAVGSAAEMRKTAEMLDTVRGQIVATYRWHSSLEPAAIEALMDAETWMTAAEAKERGFATDIVEGLQAAASLDRTLMGTLTVPEQYRARVEGWLKPAPVAKTPASALDVLRICREGGCGDLAESLIRDGAAVADVQARVAGEQTARAAARERAAAIERLCAAASQPELAEGYIAGGMTIDAVRKHLTTITAKVAGSEVDTRQPPVGGGATKARIDTAAIYAARNQQQKG